MKIERRDEENLVKACELEVGDCFLGDTKDLYLIINLGAPFSNNNFNNDDVFVVNLSSNYITRYCGDGYVTKISAKVVTYNEQ